MNLGQKTRLICSLLIVGFFFLPACERSAQIPSRPESQALLTASPTADQDQGKFIRLGYYTGSQESYQSFIDFQSYLDIVSVDVYGFHPDGTIVGKDDFNLAAQFSSEDIQFYACISNWNSDPAVNNFDRALAYAAMVTHKEKMISGLLSLAEEKGYTGINIDFENLAFSPDLEESREAFSIFIHELAEKLHQGGKKLIISVAAKEIDDPQNDWSYPFDLAVLSQDADYLQLMTYDQHGSWSGPGPISGADWFEEVVRYTSSIADPSRLLIGLPAYGYNWDLSQPDPNGDTYATTSFKWTDVPGLMNKPGAKPFWDESAFSPSLTYTEENHQHEAWFENQASIQKKVEIMSKYHLAGLSVWALGMEDESFWQATLLEDKHE